MPSECPNCGADLPPNCRACPECGSCEETGWSEKARLDHLGIPDEESFDYDEFVQREFQGRRPRRKLHWLWVATAILLFGAILLLLAFHFR